MVRSGDRVEKSQGLTPGQVLPEAQKGVKSPTGSPVVSVPTPSRGGKFSSSQNDKARASANTLEDVMRRKGVDEAWTTLEDMQRQGIVTDKYTVSRMLMKTVGDGRSKMNPSRVYRGMVLVERFIEQQPKDVDEVLFNALLDTCCRLKDLARLESTVNMMKSLQVTPSPVTLGILVKTYGQAGDLQKVLQVWEEMEQQKAQANAVTYGCMIDACVKCGSLQTAVDIFHQMRREGKHKNTILYTTLIKGYGLEKDLKSALELFHEMPHEGVPYNTITYNSVLDACVKCGDLATAEGLLQEMLAPGASLEPDLITFSTVLKGYCHSGELDKALQVAETIKARGLKCDELVYNTLMDGCVKAGDVTAGLGLFEEMVQIGLKPSAITHSILARLYQRAGYEDGASQAVAQLYQQHGLEKPVGGDRMRRGGKGGSRSGQPSPMGTPMGSPVIPSPLHSQVGSPFGLLALGRDRSETEGSYGSWAVPNMPGDYSAPQTPAAGQHMPFPEAARQAHVPPLPGAFSNETFYSNSACGSPVGTPFGAPEQVNFGFQGQPQAMFAPQGPMPPFPVVGQAGTGMPQPPPPPQAPPNVGPNGEQVFAMPMYPSAPQSSLQAPFPMPLSPPHDMVGSMAPGPAPHMQPMQQYGPQGQQQAYFEGWGQAQMMPMQQQMPQQSQQPQLPMGGQCPYSGPGYGEHIMLS
mmetsp:Transcript_83247/g.147078  ORF Transcript_83247/g.147078 Transcript_83247/m.147078 type:complete len:693 (+) Transcript_83247:45-2123(+)|eukprot:CAMPEP_0197650950 /NCGR_PEP_ID=MMETSP1338-20131121/31258_1 /TAXON_ID=43686 ORGANISM="Pelagodinium beii, Strain RCC1491" /NCGR_SAMPLE_ID=MMETSP1338 /ASSEMBLY_ACC=CAM_ASM_000754 /LENGTH=692 /DNA_ID=CAMNT_0043225475 /DNA_START=45 /DNA_END=2123 /DNA_ORIENTATION=-